MTNIEISYNDVRSLLRIGTRTYYAANTKMDEFWAFVTKNLASGLVVPSQEKQFTIVKTKKKFVMFYDQDNDTIYCELKNHN